MKHSVANYPKECLGCVVSPTKICIQFSEVMSKLRFKEGAEYVKLPSTHKALPISTDGTDVDILAVGCQMPVIEALQSALIEAYVKYGNEHGEAYKAVYGTDFKLFLLDTIQEMIDAVNQIKTKRGG